MTVVWHTIAMMDADLVASIVVCLVLDLRREAKARAN
jgi:hypothetical protein